VIFNNKTQQNFSNFQNICTTGRLRWTTENQGFNVQKNNDFELEHAYCKDENAYKVFYILLQLAHSLLQLLQNADSLKDMFRKSIKTAVALSKFIFEAWRFYCAPPNFALQICNSNKKFRLNTS